MAKHRDQGFTIVELLIVVVVIGILALLVITTYSGIQSKARNAKRQNDIKALQTQIEGFFAQYNYYPSRTDMNSATWRGTNLKSLDTKALVDPSSSCNPATTSCLVSSPQGKAYSYAVTDGSGNSCETQDSSCALYTLTATYEGNVNGSSTSTAKNLD